MVVIACSRLPDSRENEHNCVGAFFAPIFFSPTIWEPGTLRLWLSERKKKLELIVRLIHASGTQQD